MTRPRAAVASVALSAALAGGTACREREEPIDTPEARIPAVMPPSPPLYTSGPGSFVAIVESARHAVLGIRSTTKVKSGPAAMFPGAPDSAPDQALGTGFLIESRGVYVLTNDHIAAGASELVAVMSDGDEYPLKIIGRDPTLDLALLAIEPRPGSAGSAGSAVGLPKLRPLQLGDSDQVGVGEWIVVLGNPFGDGVTASAGLLSSHGHEGALLQGRDMTHRSYLQTDARIHRGNSGGPVLDTVGNVIGVAIASGDRPGELSFAIPINRVKEIVAALRDHGQIGRGWLGAYVDQVTPALAQSLGLGTVTGAVITDVRAGSPAARYGLRRGDVILRWGKTPVDNRSLPWAVAATPIGTPTAVELWRNRVQVIVTLQTDKMPE